MKSTFIKIKKIDREMLIIILFSILPIIDSINGWLVLNGGPSIGTLYKLLLIGILMIVMCLSDGNLLAKRIVLLCSPVIYIVSVVLINVLMGGTIINSDYPVKLIFNIMLLYLLMELLRKKIILGTTIYKILKNNCILISIVVLVPYVLGLGNNIYAGDIGYKGFYYSQNELCASLLILFYFCLYEIICAMNIKRVLLFLGISVCMLLTNSKSAMVACGVGVVVFLIEYLRRKESKNKLIVIIFLLIGIVIAEEFIRQQVMGFLTRQTSLARLYDNSFIAVLTSGRTYKLEDAWQQLLTSETPIFHFLFGNGFCSEILVEMDFIDIFFYLGIFGLFATLAFVYYIYKKSLKYFKLDRSTIRLVGYLLVIGFAFVVGHVFFMVTAGCYFVLLCCFNTTFSVNDNEKG